MKPTPLFRHGEHIKPHYAPVTGENWAGKSTDADRPDGQNSGIFKRYRKNESASKTAIALALIKKTYADAIEYTSKPQRLKGYMLAMAAIFSLVLVWGAQSFWSIPDGTTSTIIFGRGVAVSAILLMIYFFLNAIRQELFQPQDQPTIFDRKHRKVYRIFSEVQPGVVGLFKPWPMRTVEYEWDLIDVEHTTAIATTGSTITQHHALVFIVRKCAEDPTIIDSFNIGTSLELGEPTVPAVWEHIRRFMEEQGPHLPPGEGLLIQEPPASIKQRLSTWAENYVWWWKNELPMMLLFHAIFPLSIAIILVKGFFSWLGYKTSKPIVWPSEVLAAIGPETTPR